MKSLARSVLFTGAFVIAANGSMAAQASSSWYEQWHKAKFGRSSAMEEARQKAERENTAFREESRHTVAPRNDWFEQWYKAKFGRISPSEEARRKAEGR